MLEHLSQFQRELPESVDIVFVGTSPLVLCRALLESNKGKRVLILDRRLGPGGAWHWGSLSGYNNVESAVHLIENRCEVYQWLERLGIELSPETMAFGMLGNVKLPLPPIRFLMFAALVAKSVFKGNLSGARSKAESMVRSLGSLRCAFRYPKGGAAALVNHFLKKLEVRGVIPTYGIDVMSADIKSGGRASTLETSLGQVKFGQLALASCAHCPLSLDGEPIDLKLTQTETCCVAVHLDDVEQCNFSYVELIRDRLVRQIRNISPIAVPRPNNPTAIILIQLRTEALPNGMTDNALTNKVLERIKRYRLVPALARAIDSRCHRYRFCTIPDWRLEQLTDICRDSVIAIRTTDFSEELLTTLRQIDASGLNNGF